MLPHSEENRIFMLDVLRGFAILGILLANITSFATPVITSQFALSLPDRSSAEALFDILTLIFVNGKFRSILAILFGVGLWMQYEKRSAAGTWPKSYLKRMAWLLLIGLIHGYLIWWGDILSTYAVVAVLALVVVKSSDKTLWWLIAALEANALLTAAVLVPGLIYVSRNADPGEWTVGAVWPMFSTAGETIVYQSGTWIEQLTHRAVYFSLNLTYGLVFGLVLMPLFLFGILLARKGVLSAPSEHPEYVKGCFLAAFGLGLPLSMLSLLPLSVKDMEILQLGFEIFIGPLLALGYLMAIALLVERGRAGWIAQVLAKVGRVALSAYLLQSVACTFVFYTWGLGLFGKLQPIGWLLVVLVVWSLDVAFALLWLRWFRMGPTEWLWRSLAASKRLPMRRSTYNEPERGESL
ncbi:MAG: DUF418 domain-containing protein [Fimbriimonas sp.]